MAATAMLERSELLDMCERLGYPEALREEDFPVWRKDLVAEIACFAAPEPKNMATATMVAGTALGDHQRTHQFAVARALAAPICLLRAESDWAVFSVQSGVEAKLLSDGPPDENPALARFLAPEALLAAKREPQQLSLLDVDIALLDTARGAAGRELDRRVRRIIAGLLDEDSSPASAETAARLVVRALTALVARDKLTVDRSLDSAIARVQELSPSHLQGVGHRQIVDVAERLGDGLNFQTLDPALLGDVYERAVLIPAKRLALGVYYTPPEIGRRMLDQLPIEHVEPDQRRFLDPSCGSGTLLLAANDRLMASLADDVDDRRRHEYALERLIGADNDPFAVELARLALFLQALPYGNGYRVEQQDALVATATETKATFTVSNPPWAYKHQGGEREQRADQFLRRLVARTEPGGFVACVLPASWLTDDTSRDSRGWLREQADIFEIWRLPTRSFRTSTMAPCVVFAQVGTRSTSTYRYFNVWNTGRDQFRDDGVADEALIAAFGKSQGPLTSSWLAKLPELADVTQLGEVAAIRDGVPVKGIGRLDPSGPHPFLRAYSEVAPFGVVERRVTTRCRYPDDFSKRGPAASPELYLKPKILVSAMTSVDVPWRLRAFVDPIGVIPRNSMYAVVPYNDSGERNDALMTLLGLLSSALASLWIAQGTATRMINARSIAALPVPSVHAWPSIAEATRCVVESRAAGARLDSHVRALDRVVFDAFGLSKPSVARIAAALAGQRAPEGVVRFEATSQPRDDMAVPAVIRAGATVDVHEGTVKLDIPGLTQSGGVWIETPLRLPGWLARPGRTFDVLVAGSDLRQARYRFQGDGWMSLDDLLAEFT
jgi:hypothetical protein